MELIVSTLSAFDYSIFIANLSGSCNYYPHFADEETKVRNLLQVIDQ
jgi:hypothetical protein